MPELECPRIVCEIWTPGRHGSADGPSREMHYPCREPRGHEGSHRWGAPIEVIR